MAPTVLQNTISAVSTVQAEQRVASATPYEDENDRLPKKKLACIICNTAVGLDGLTEQTVN